MAEGGLFFPAVGEKLTEFCGIPVDGQAGENVVEVFGEVHTAHPAASGEAAENRGGFPGVRTADEKEILPSDHHRTDGFLGGIF